MIDIAEWQREGYSLEQIRELIDEKYPRYGDPTDTKPIAQLEDHREPISSTAGSAEGPRISFDVDSVDLGKVDRDIPINYAFHFKNTGNATLTIMDAWARVLVGC